VTAVHWTPEALARLEDIEAYIAQDSPSVAKDVVAQLLARARQLETAPRSGRQMQEYARADLREVLERPYRLIYRITAERVEILTVMHYRQLLPRNADVLSEGPDGGTAALDFPDPPNKNDKHP
jgi:toxin ParE1/3/4